MELKKIKLYLLLALIIVVIIGVGILYNKEPISEPTSELFSLGGQAGHFVDVVGTRIGTSTTAVAFTNNDATSTYPILIGREYDSVSFNIQAKTFGAGGGNNAYFSIFASNDYDCATASTTTTMANTVVTGDINWFDAKVYLRNLAGSSTLNSGDAMITWIPVEALEGIIIPLEGLNTNCLALEINASGTEMWVQAEKKKFK